MLDHTVHFLITNRHGRPIPVLAVHVRPMRCSAVTSPTHPRRPAPAGAGA